MVFEPAKQVGAMYLYSYVLSSYKACNPINNEQAPYQKVLAQKRTREYEHLRIMFLLK